MTHPLPRPRSELALAATVGRGLTGLCLAMLAGCGTADNDLGDARVGQAIITQQDCGACHSIPGISGAEGTAGPPLDHFATQPRIAGVVPNSPAALVGFLRAPESMVKNSAMPNIALTETQARQIAAYLYTLN